MSFLERQRAATAASKTVVDLTKDSKSTLAPPSPSPSVASTTSALAGTTASTPKKKNRPGDGADIFSQPALTGTGAELGTQLVYAVNHLKEKDRDLTITDIVDHLTRRPASEAEWAELVENLRKHPRVKWLPDPSLTEQNTRSGTYAHNPVIPNVRTKEQLLRYLQGKRDAMGTLVKDLEDGWPRDGLYAALTELEREHKILVQRTKKDNHPRLVWQDDASLWHEVDPEFQALWHKTNLPALDDINRLLTQAGQKPASEDPRLKVVAAKVDKKKKKPKRKIQNYTNTHLLKGSGGHLSMFKDM